MIAQNVTRCCYVSKYWTYLDSLTCMLFELCVPDVKPSNTLVNTQGNVKLCDFGVSVQVSYVSDTQQQKYQ